MKSVLRYSKEINDLILQVDKNQDYKARTRTSISIGMHFWILDVYLTTSWTPFWPEMISPVVLCQISYDEFATFLEMGKGGGTAEQHSSLLFVNASWNEAGSDPKPAAGGGMKMHRDAWKCIEYRDWNVQCMLASACWEFPYSIVQITCAGQFPKKEVNRTSIEEGWASQQMCIPVIGSSPLYGRNCPWITTWLKFQEQELIRETSLTSDSSRPCDILWGLERFATVICARWRSSCSGHRKERMEHWQESCSGRRCCWRSHRCNCFCNSQPSPFLLSLQYQYKPCSIP